MRNRKLIYLSESDAEQLCMLIETMETQNQWDRVFIESLEREIDRARILPSARIPDDVVRLNSRVKLTDLETGEVFEFQIVLPSEVDFEEGRISVLSPIGTGLLGYRVNDVILWDVPGGTRKLKIEQMLDQPDAVGDFFQ